MDVYGIALILPDKIGKELNRLRNGFNKDIYYITIPHITLIHPFIPNVSVNLLIERLTQIAERTKRFTLTVTGIEYAEGKNNMVHIVIVNKQPIIDLYRVIAISTIGPIKDREGNLNLNSYTPQLIIGQNIPDDIFPQIKKKLAGNIPDYKIEIDTFGIFIRNPEFLQDKDKEWTIVKSFALSG